MGLFCFGVIIFGGKIVIDYENKIIKFRMVIFRNIKFDDISYFELREGAGIVTNNSYMRIILKSGKRRMGNGYATIFLRELGKQKTSDMVEILNEAIRRD